MLIEVDTPEAILSTQLTETSSTVEAVRNLFWCWGRVILLNYGLVLVLRVKADMKGTISFTGVCKRRHHMVGKELDTITPFAMSLRVHSICSWYTMGTFLLECWTRAILVSPDCVDTGHVGDCIKWAGEGTVEGNYVLDHYMGGGGWLSWVRFMGLKS